MSKIGELFKKANTNDDGSPKKLSSEDFIAASMQIWEQTLPEGMTVEMATQLHLHDQVFASMFAKAVAVRAYEMGKVSNVTVSSGVEAVEVLELPGDVTINASAFGVHTPQMDYIVGYTEYKFPEREKAEAMINKNNPGNLWDF